MLLASRCVNTSSEKLKAAAAAGEGKAGEDLYAMAFPWSAAGPPAGSSPVSGT
jgi:hypothetical protein